jgi:hypothetical protein
MAGGEGRAGLGELLPARMKLEPLAAEIGLNAAFLARRVAYLVAGLGERSVCCEETG